MAISDMFKGVPINGVNKIIIGAGLPTLGFYNLPCTFRNLGLR
jgi:hypothetical protein